MSRGFLPKQMPLRFIRFAAAKPKLVLGGYFLLLLLSAWITMGLKIDSDFLALIPDNNPKVNAFRDTVVRFGSVDLMLVALEMDEDGELDDYLEYADWYAEGLRESEHIQWVDYRLQDFLEAAEEMLDRVTLLMSPEDLDVFLGKLNEAGAKAAAADVAAQLRSPLAAANKDLLLRDPLGVAPLLTDQLGIKKLGPRFHGSTGYLIDEDERFLLMVVKPTKPAADLPFSRMLLDELEALKSRCETEWQEEGFAGSPPKLLFAGGYPIAVAESGLIIDDMTVGIIFAMIAVVFLFTFAFGRFRAILISSVPLVCGLMITFAFLALVLGQLNSATSVFAALLIGLGVDFIIVLYGRYLEERGKGLDHDHALEVIGSGTALGVLLGAVTTGATFYAFLISDFRGLSELGLLTGTGVLILVTTVFFMLPALLTLLEKGRPPQKFTLRAFGLQRLTGFSLNHPRLVVGSALVLTLVTGLFAFKVRYDDDVLNMRSPHNPGLQAQNRIMDAFGVRFTPIMIRLDAPTEAEAVSLSKRVVETLMPLVDGETLIRVDTALSVLPEMSRQNQVIQRLSQFSFDKQAYMTTMATALEAEGLNPQRFLKNLDPVLDAVSVDKPLTLETMHGSALEHIVARYLVVDENNASAVIYAYPPAGKWRGQIPPKLEEAVSHFENVVVTGPVAVSIELKKIVLKDALIAALFGTLIVFLFLAWDLGGFVAGAFALFPLAGGMIWMLGIMGIFDLPVNFMNIFVFTMIIGIGVDYGVHLLHRHLEGEGDLQGTSKAVVIAAITTVLGFGSLVLSHYPGLRSVGSVAGLGAVSTAIAAVMVLPALLKVTGFGSRDKSER